MSRLAAQTFLWWNAVEWTAIGAWFTGSVTLGLIYMAFRQLRNADQQVEIANEQTRIANEQTRLAADQIERATEMNAENLAAQRLLADEQSRPYVVAELTSRGDEGGILQITNIGATPAFAVRLELAETWVPAADVNVSWQYSQAFKSGLPLMPPGHKIRFFLDLMDRRVERDDLPMEIDLTIRYVASNFREFFEIQRVDLDVYMEALMHDKGLHALVSETERIRRSVEKWTADHNRGLAVYSTSADLERDRRKRQMDAAVAELATDRANSEPLDQTYGSPLRRASRVRLWLVQLLTPRT